MTPSAEPRAAESLPNVDDEGIEKRGQCRLKQLRVFEVGVAVFVGGHPHLERVVMSISCQACFGLDGGRPERRQIAPQAPLVLWRVHSHPHPLRRCQVLLARAVPRTWRRLREDRRCSSQEGSLPFIEGAQQPVEGDLDDAASAAELEQPGLGSGRREIHQLR